MVSQAGKECLSLIKGVELMKSLKSFYQFSFLLLTFFILFPNLSFGSRKPETPNFVLRGKIDSYYKNQNSYKTPLDYGNNPIRSGADNREYQNTRTKAELEYIPYSNGLHDPNNSNTKKWVGYFRLEADFNDPDQGNDGTIDHKLTLADAWIRWAPHIALGIKLGKTSIVPTVNPRLSTDFKGDLDEDFVLNGASGLSGFNGIAVDVNYQDGKNKYQIGLAQLQGMSKGGQIASGGASATRSMTKVYWGTYKGDSIDLQLARQYVSSSQNLEKRLYNNNHIFQNWMIKYGRGLFQPFIGEQKFWGEKTNVYWNADQIQSAVGNVFPSRSSCKTPESNYGKFTLTTFGFQGKHKSISWAYEKTYSDTPKYCDYGTVLPISEIDYMSHFQIGNEFENGISAFFFSHQVATKRDNKLRENIKSLEEDVQQLSSIPADLSAISTPVSQYNDGLKGQTWTDTKSSGIGFFMRF